MKEREALAERRVGATIERSSPFLFFAGTTSVVSRKSQVDSQSQVASRQSVASRKATVSRKTHVDSQSQVASRQSVASRKSKEGEASADSRTSTGQGLGRVALKLDRAVENQTILSGPRIDRRPCSE